QSLSLLSGGEKALTATALILSLFLIRPTPFCLLDEVDAPLDEANIGRFNQLVRDMATTSQFVLITHNRRTMEVADTLYGITMERAGISKVVADVGMRTTATLLDRLRQRVGRSTEPAEVRRALREEMVAMLDAPPPPAPTGRPWVILVTGVNGVGKTTTIGKLGARQAEAGR